MKPLLSNAETIKRLRKRNQELETKNRHLEEENKCLQEFKDLMSGDITELPKIEFEDWPTSKPPQSPSTMTDEDGNQYIYVSRGEK